MEMTREKKRIDTGEENWGEGEEDTDDWKLDYVQMFQETSRILFHQQPEQFRRCLQEIVQYYLKSYQENQRIRPKTQNHDENSDGNSLPSNGVIVGSAVNIRDNRPLSKEVDLSSQLLATRTVCFQCMSCNVKDIIPLFQAVSFPVLSHLNLSFNQIRDFTLPETILNTISSNLMILDLSHNKINSVEGLASFQRLKILRLHHNHIETISSLQTCFNLEELWLSYNRIDWIQFTFLSKLEKLKILVKQNNPCDNKSKCNEFLINILPSIQIIDMEKVVIKSNRDKEEGGGVENSKESQKIAVDTKVMITQAKAFLKKHLENKGKFYLLRCLH